MKHALFLFAALFSTSLACDIKPGYIAHGLIKDKFEMDPMCSLSETMKNQIPGSKWIEVWMTTNDSAGKQKVASLKSGLESKGFKLKIDRPTKNGKVFGYANGRGDTLALFTSMNASLIFVAIGGK